MLLHFHKYHGAGNDFILIDNREGLIKLNEYQVRFLCDRHLGIGADGLMLLEKSDKAAFSMVFYNPDGSSGMMCGNGGRCIAAFAKDIGAINEDEFVFSAPDTMHSAMLLSDNLVSISMQDVDQIEFYPDGLWLNTGTSHFVCKVEDINKIDIQTIGKTLRYDKRFEKHNGCNVNFYSSELVVRTYERGVEAETLACGTGITAVALTYALQENFDDGRHTISMKSSEFSFRVTFKKKGNSFSDIILSGPVKKVFQGFIEL